MTELRRWPFALFYFWYYAALGAFSPWIGRFVDGLGHGGYVLGAMLALQYGTRVIAPPLWSEAMSRLARPGLGLVAGAAATLVLFAAFTMVESAAALLLVMAGFGLFYNALMPQFEAMTLTALGRQVAGYARIRLWGSIGFLLVAASYGLLLDRYGDRAFPWLSLPLFVALLAAAWMHRNDRPPAPPTGPVDPLPLWRRPGVRRFLLVVLLMQAGFGPFYVFYTLHLMANGHGGGSIGLLWAIGVLAEIVLFWRAPQLLHRFGAERLMAAALAVTVARWLLTAFMAHSLPLMLLAQLSHAFGFALFHACCMRRMADLFPGADALRGQGLLYGIGTGIGGVLGALAAALAWDLDAGRGAFVLGAVLAAAALAVLVLAAPGRHRASVDRVLP